MDTDTKLFEADYTWVHENRDSLIKQYADRWVGVKNRQVVASDSDLDELLSKLQDPGRTVVEFITPTQIEVVL